MKTKNEENEINEIPETTEQLKFNVNFCGGQADKDVDLGSEGLWFESSERKSTSLLGSLLLAAVPYLKNDVDIYLIRK